MKDLDTDKVMKLKVFPLLMEYFNNNTELVTKVIPKDKEGLFKEFIGKCYQHQMILKKQKLKTKLILNNVRKQSHNII